ncbi:MAG: SRPBCC domain-containing protein, partial [Deltaproteobacteria bacterium]|nr:SRPBCC domain-containing protein [Deltaproteobacteria bacterium]
MSDDLVLFREIQAPRAVVWRALSQPEGLALWTADEVSGDVRRGGSLRLAWPALGAETTLDVVELDAGERVAFDDGDTRVTLAPTRGGVELRQAGTLFDRPGLASSWALALAHLGHALEVHPGRRRTATWVHRTVRVTPELAHLHFTEPRLLSQWLGRPAELGRVGEPISLDLPGLGALSGRVLVREPGRDLAFTWQQLGDAVVALRTLPGGSPGTRVVALTVSRYDAARPVPLPGLAELDASLARLAALLAQS